MALLRSYSAMLPRLTAEADLTAVQVAAVARMVEVEPTEASSWMADQQRAANGAAGSEARPTPATPEALAAMGIAVVMEPAHV